MESLKELRNSNEGLRESGQDVRRVKIGESEDFNGFIENDSQDSNDLLVLRVDSDEDEQIYDSQRHQSSMQGAAMF